MRRIEYTKLNNALRRIARRIEKDLNDNSKGYEVEGMRYAASIIASSMGMNFHNIQCEVMGVVKPIGLENFLEEIYLIHNVEIEVIEDDGTLIHLNMKSEEMIEPLAIVVRRKIDGYEVKSIGGMYIKGNDGKMKLK